MGTAARHHHSPLDEYFAIERNTPNKHEYVDGRIFAMAGGSLRHDVLETRILQALAARLVGRPCLPMTSNRRIAVDGSLYSYADGSVFCGEIEVGPEQTARNPVVVVEVLSESTRAYDRGEKLRRYQEIPSLRHILLIEQVRVDVEVWSRGPDGWSRSVVTDPEGTVSLPAIEVDLPLAELYAGLDRYPAG